MLGAGPQPPDLVLDDRLLELDFGPYEGWSEQELAADPLAVTRRRDGAEIPDVEPSSNRVDARCCSAFNVGAAADEAR